jgi:hypothetical protein
VKSAFLLFALLLGFGLPPAQAETPAETPIARTKALANAKAKLRAALENHDSRAIADAENRLDSLCREDFGPACHILGAYYLSLGKIAKAQTVLTSGCEKKDEPSCLEIANYYADHRKAAERAAWLKQACTLSGLERPCRLSRDMEFIERARKESSKPIQR